MNQRIILIDSRLKIRRIFKRQKGFLLVSHDRYFIDSCCDHVIAINPQSIDVVNGNYSTGMKIKPKKMKEK